jgi:hypothetical protein
MTKHTEALLDASQEAGLKVKTEKIKYMFMSYYQTTVQNNNTKVVNKSFEYAEKFKYFGMTVKNQSCIHEHVKSRLNSRNACYHSIRNILSSCSLLKTIKIKIYTTINIL